MLSDDLASCSPRRAIAVTASSAPRSRLLCSSSPLFYCLHARLLSIVGQLCDAHPSFSLHYCSVCYRFHILVDTSTLAQFSLPSSCVLADLASCSPRRAIAVPASSAPTFLSPLPVSSIASLSSCSLAADRWPNFRCLYLLSSLHYCSVCYQFHILVNSFDPFSIQPPLLLCAS